MKLNDLINLVKWGKDLDPKTIELLEYLEHGNIQDRVLDSFPITTINQAQFWLIHAAYACERIDSCFRQVEFAMSEIYAYRRTRAHRWQHSLESDEG